MKITKQITTLLLCSLSMLAAPACEMPDELDAEGHASMAGDELPEGVRIIETSEGQRWELSGAEAHAWARDAMEELAFEEHDPQLAELYSRSAANFALAQENIEANLDELDESEGFRAAHLNITIDGVLQGDYAGWEVEASAGRDGVGTVHVDTEVAIDNVSHDPPMESKWGIGHSISQTAKETGPCPSSCFVFGFAQSGNNTTYEYKYDCPPGSPPPGYCGGGGNGGSGGSGGEPAPDPV